MKSVLISLGRRVSAASLAAACLMLAVSAALGMFQVLMRFVFEQPAEWTEVVIRFALIWMVFLGLAEAFRTGAMVSIDLAQRLSPPPVRRVLHAATALASITLLVLIIWFGWDYAQRGRVQTMAGLESLSMFWAYLALPAGSLLALFGVIGNLLEPQNHELDNAL